MAPLTGRCRLFLSLFLCGDWTRNDGIYVFVVCVVYSVCFFNCVHCGVVLRVFMLTNQVGGFKRPTLFKFFFTTRTFWVFFPPPPFLWPSCLFAGERVLRTAAALLPQAVRHQVPGVQPGRVPRGAQQAGRRPEGRYIIVRLDSFAPQCFENEEHYHILIFRLLSSDRAHDRKTHVAPVAHLPAFSAPVSTEPRWRLNVFVRLDAL